MEITIKLVRRHYWQARFPHYPEVVGEGRTSKEAIGHLILLVVDLPNPPDDLQVQRLPDGEFSKLKAGG